MEEKFVYLKDLRSRKGRDNRIYIIAAISIIFVIIISTSIWAIRKRKDNIVATSSIASSSIASEESKTEGIDYESILSSYSNLGIVNIDEGYLNIRKEAGKDKDLVGRLYIGSAVDILETIEVPEQGTWLHIKSGDIEGYVSSDKILTGEEAKEVAKANIKERAIITVDE